MIRKQAIQNGFPVPPEIENKPELQPHLQVYWMAFWQLTTCRNALYMTEGQIPWHVVDDWGKGAGMTRDERQDLWLAISTMDNVYLDHKSKQLERNAQTNVKTKAR